MKALAGVLFAKGLYIVLGEDGRWQASDEDMQWAANAANQLSRPPFYSYSPAHGPYGPLLAKQVAERLKGKVKLPPASPGSEKESQDIIY